MVQEQSNPGLSGYGTHSPGPLRRAFVAAGINTTSAAWDGDGLMIMETSDRLGRNLREDRDGGGINLLEHWAK